MRNFLGKLFSLAVVAVVFVLSVKDGFNGYKVLRDANVHSAPDGEIIGVLHSGDKVCSSAAGIDGEWGVGTFRLSL